MSAVQTRNDAYFDHRDSGRMGAQQQLILNRIAASNAKYGPHDFSLREIAALTGLDINAVSGRCNDLKKAGLLVESEKRSCRVTGRTITPVKVPDLTTAFTE